MKMLLRAMVLCGVVCGAGSWTFAADAPSAAELEQASEILDATGVMGGVIVHVGCGDGRLTAAFAKDGYIVQGLETDEEHVSAARKCLASLELYGKVTAKRFDGQHLPYLDNYVNLLVGKEPASLSREEILRVLVPGGVAYLGHDSRWEKIVKSPRQGVDEWTHYLHDASGNAVAHDIIVSPPRYLQWLAEPEWSRTHSHMGSMMGLVSAEGRVFAVADEGSIAYPNNEANWSLSARDAYNGVLLWRVPIQRYQDHMWRLKNGPAQLPRRLVAEGDRVYVTLDINGPLSAVDAATGKILYSCKPSTGTEEIILSEGVLFLLVNPKRLQGDPPEPVASSTEASSKTYGEYPKAIVAVEAATGNVLWQHTTPVLPMTLAADGRRVYFHDGEKICSLDRKTGSQLWTTPPIARARPILASYSPTLIVYREVVVFTGGAEAGSKSAGATSAFDANTGRQLWTVPESGTSSSSPSSLFGIGGLVWYGDVGGGGRSRQITGLDLLTGETRQTILSDTDNLNYHARCYRNKATDRYFLSNIRGVEFVDLAQKHWDVNLTMRGGCSFGVMPANGMTYMTPHPCTCYVEAKLNGFYAAYGDGKPAGAQMPEPAERLTRGPAYEVVSRGTASADYTDEWPVFRHDNSRSGSTDLQIPAELKTAWQSKLGGRLSTLTVAEGKVFVAAVDAHTLYAVDSISGKTIWSFLTGARIDSPPTIYQGRVYFGCADGRVYCLSAADGALVWKFLAAANDRQLLSYGQFESVHPLHGSVLIENGTLYCMAGRSMFLDGGLRFYRLDPLTGKEISLSVLDEIDPTTGKNLQDKVTEQTLPPAVPDILSSDGKFIYLRTQRFDLDGRRPEVAASSKKAEDLFAVQRGATAHLFARGGFLEDSGFHRLFWTYGKVDFGGHQGDPFVPPYTPTGDILAFNDTHVFGYAGDYKGGRLKDSLFSIPKTPQIEDDGQVPRTSRKERKRDRKAAEPDGAVQEASAAQLKYDWMKKCPLEITAMAVAGKVLFADGCTEVGNPELLAYAIEDGRLLSEVALPAPPAFDGMAAAQSRLYLTLKDGSVLCLEPAEGPH
ncbi:MAG: PQQ-binding-like beta-propeller repeat protein [Planctomycetota bacterium]